MKSLRQAVKQHLVLEFSLAFNVTSLKSYDQHTTYIPMCHVAFANLNAIAK
jgi:hypothetical protein